MKRTFAVVALVAAALLALGGCGPGHGSRGGTQGPTTPPPPATEPGITPPPPTAATPTPVVAGFTCFGRIKKQSTPTILSVTRRGGRGIPNSTLTYRIGAENYNIQGPSTDPEYGYTPQKPIFTGGKFVNGSARQWRFLMSLLDPGGQRVYFERLGSCCPFRDPKGTRTGLVDVYGIIMKGYNRRVLLYVSFYASTNEPIWVPMCFKFRQDAGQFSF